MIGVFLFSLFDVRSDLYCLGGMLLHWYRHLPPLPKLTQCVHFRNSLTKCFHQQRELYRSSPNERSSSSVTSVRAVKTFSLSNLMLRFG